jgi:hypothetical protein
VNLKDLKNYEIEENSLSSKPLNISDIGNDYTVEDTQPSDEIGMTESGLRGAAQGLSFSLADELTGATEAGTKAILGGDKLSDLMENYRKYRDESRADYKAAEEANPAAYMTGEIGSGIAAGLLTGGAGAVANLGKVGLQQGAKELAKVGLRQGAAAGFGASEADLTKGEVGDVLKDTAIGGGMGAAAGVVLPTVAKGAGKAIGKVSDYAVDKAPSLVKKGKAAYDLAKKGIEVVGGNAQKSVDLESSNLANDIINSFKTQYEEGSKMVGSALKSAPKSDFSAQMSKIENALKTSKMLPDDLNRIQNELDMYKQLKTTETIDPGMDKAIAQMESLIEKQKGESSILGQKSEFVKQPTTESGGFLQTLKRTFAPEGGETASVLQVPIPEDKVITDTIESFRNMDLQELNNVKKELATFISGNKNISSQSKSILSGIKKELDDTIASTMNPQSADLYKSGNKQMSGVYDAGELLGMVSPDKKFAKDLDIGLKSKILSGSKQTQETLDRAMDYGTQITPEMKALSKELPFRQELLKDVKGEGGLFGGLINPKGIAIRTGESIGKVAGSKVVETAKDFTKKLIMMPDDKVANAANKMANSQNEAVKNMGTTLAKALQDSTKRDRLLWSLSQQPAFREMFRSTEQEDESLGQ